MEQGEYPLKDFMIAINSAEKLKLSKGIVGKHVTFGAYVVLSCLILGVFIAVKTDNVYIILIPMAGILLFAFYIIRKNTEVALKRPELALLDGAQINRYMALSLLSAKSFPNPPTQSELQTDPNKQLPLLPDKDTIEEENVEE